MKKKSLLLLVALIMSISGVFAQQAARSVGAPKLNVVIKGQALDSLTNETLPYATLKIATADNSEKAVKLLATDDDGKFNTVLDVAGSYLLIVQYVGKKPSSTPFEIVASDKVIDLGKIYVVDNQTLEEVVVTAFKPLVSIDLDKITYSTEDDPDSKTNNVLDMLKKVPLITVDADEKIELKGSGSFKIYLDGKPSNMISANPTQVLRSMPANMVKSIEVITDPGAKYDAEGVTGIINIITNKQPMGGYTANLNAGVTSTGGYSGNLYATLKYGKIGVSGSYNYSYQQSPSTPYTSYTENQNPYPGSEKYLFQNGSSKHNGNFQFGNGEFSFEIDTLNLLTAAFNRFGGTSNSTTGISVYGLGINNDSIFSYNQNSKNKNTFGTSDFNVDYQRTFGKKDELLTASYKYSYSPNDSYSKTSIDSILMTMNSKRDLNNDANDKEHTFQLDYTTPLAKIHTIESGVKYIIRLNESESNNSMYDFITQKWMPWSRVNDHFKYRYDIAAGYLGYNLRYNSYGLKVGVRFEDTKIEAEYPLNTAQNFDKHYFTWVPSATTTYRFKQIHSLRLGYNMRVQRPGIWFLNPYVNSSDPKYVSQGNPDLDVEKAHNIGLTYSVFKPKINLNAGLNYNLVNNSIQRITSQRQYDNGDTYNYSSYKNIGKQDRVSFDLYFNWNPNMKLRMYMNGSTAYTDLKANDGSGMSNSGFDGRLFGNIQYTLPKDFRITISGGGGSQRIGLQGESSGFYFTGIGLNKSFLNKKLNISLNGSNLFEKYISYWSFQKTDNFHTRTDGNYVARNVNIRVSYQFGEMKQQIKKTSRGISNDDSKAGEGNSQGGEGQQGN